MHFWNKLSTAALMRLTILASLNLIMGRLVGNWLILLHPVFFLAILTIDLGLYALMVYSGTLNKTLIGMMLGGLAGVLGVIGFAGVDPSAFGYGSPFQAMSHQIESFIDAIIEPLSPSPPRVPFRFAWYQQAVVGYVAVDLTGLILIAVGGYAARVLRARSRRRDPSSSRTSP